MPAARWPTLTAAVLMAALVGVALGRTTNAEDAAAPLPPSDAARTMQVPPGFQVTLFAGEPDVVQPVGFCIDDRGRLWVAEALNYPHRDRPPRDRIVILEDQDGDGRFDKRTVFYDRLNYVSGIEVGFGGVWVMSPPSFYFIPDRDGDDTPDSPPQVLLDGFGAHANAHNMANGFAWGPDGWLYGTHGRTNWSLPGKPGKPDSERQRFDGGVWRYHPVRHVWEPFADGTTNPWGIDFDDYGQGFVCNCVNPHLFHVIQGAHYEPWRNRKSSQYAYERIDTIADHLHFLGGGNVRAAIGSEEELEAGGGHAHCGTMVYLGDNWPARYRNTVFMNNIHGRRINNDVLRRKGSGYTASHASDIMIASDPWYMGVTLQYGPDGGVFASDWSDTGECHSVRNTQVGTGRIYKITYGATEHRAEDVSRLSDEELVRRQTHANDWHVRHARRVLQERAAAGREMSPVHEGLRQILDGSTETPHRLRALWAMHVTGGLPADDLVPLLEDSSEYVRAWAVRLLCERDDPGDAALTTFRRLAAEGDSPFVRLHLASALQRLAPERRWPLAEALIARGEDADDPNLPLMIWYGVEPLVNEDLERFVELAVQSRLSLIRRHVARRAASLTALEVTLRVLAEADDPRTQSDMLSGMLQGLAGRRSVEMPPDWPTVYDRLRQSQRADVRRQALELALLFEDTNAFETLRAQVTDPRQDPADRRHAIELLTARQDRQLPALLLRVVTDESVQRAALRSLAEFDYPATPEAILERYSRLAPAARQDALQTLAARTAWADRLLDAVESGSVPRTDLNAYTVRQIGSLGDRGLRQRLERVWGRISSTSAEKSRLIAAYQRQLTPTHLERADLSAGRLLFQKTCASCHMLFGEGGKIGPDITGSQRGNLQYLLENIVDPSAAVAKDYQMRVLVTSGGRVITGQVLADDDASVTIQTVNEKLVVPRDEIDLQRQSPLSLMPDGLLQKLSDHEIRDLIGYLSSPRQVAFPEGEVAIPEVEEARPNGEGARPETEGAPRGTPSPRE